jgi:hypothetical protein
MKSLLLSKLTLSECTVKAHVSLKADRYSRHFFVYLYVTVPAIISKRRTGSPDEGVQQRNGSAGKTSGLKTRPFGETEKWNTVVFWWHSIMLKSLK